MYGKMNEMNGKRSAERGRRGSEAGIERESGRRMGLLASLFGCWHRKVCRPITRDGRTFIVCIRCGARKRYDPENLR